MCTKHYQRWKAHGDASIVLDRFADYAKFCSVDNCENPVLARALCRKHYQRWQKHGDPLVTLLDLSLTPEQRFWAKVNKNGPIPEYRPELGQCWVWTGGLAEGYGAFYLDGRQVKAHIVSFELAGGKVEAWQERDHLCRNRACVRPDHLQAVTHWVNVARGISPHGKNAVKTHCPQGHPYDETNTRIDKHGRRNCIICRREQCRRSYHKRAARLRADKAA